MNQLRLSTYAYKNNYGQFPEGLNDLIPDYLSEIPEDPHKEGEKLQYSKEERVIYSQRADEVSEEDRENYKIHLH